MPIAVKLFFLAVRQVSKPLAAVAKRGATESPLLRQVIVSIGQTINRARIQVTRMADGKTSLANISPLNEEKAVAVGAELVSEGVIYTIAGSTVFYEWRMTKREKEQNAAKAAAAEVRRREEQRLNEERQWAEFSHLNKRITLLQEELWLLRRQQEQRERESGTTARQKSLLMWWR
jgi:DNA-binding transcriptional MocR family regulator